MGHPSRLVRKIGEIAVGVVGIKHMEVSSRNRILVHDAHRTVHIVVKIFNFIAVWIGLPDCIAKKVVGS